jgi:hypothetical protein
MTGIEYSAPMGYITSIGRPTFASRRVAPTAVEHRAPPPPPRLAWKVHGLLLPFGGHTVEHGEGRDVYSADTVFDGGPYLELRCEHSGIIGGGRVIETKAGLMFDGEVWIQHRERADARRWMSAGLTVVDSHRTAGGVTVVDRARLGHASLVRRPASDLCYATLRVA